MKEISGKTLLTKWAQNSPAFKLINAQEPAFFELKHIPGSLNLFKKEDVLAQLKPEDDIVVYCTNTCCKRSIVLYFLLKELKYENVSRFSGGLQEWELMGLPVSGKMVELAAL
jgi:rhodanese-related sulfurtransferase